MQDQFVGLREAKKIATRRALHIATVDLTLEAGLDAVTVEQICARVGVSVRTFFNYFESKDKALLGPDVHFTDASALEGFLAGGPSGDLFPDILHLIEDLISMDFPDRTDAERMSRLVQAEPRVLSVHLERFTALEAELAHHIAQRRATGTETNGAEPTVAEPTGAEPNGAKSTVTEPNGADVNHSKANSPETGGPGTVSSETTGTAKTPAGVSSKDLPSNGHAPDGTTAFGTDDDHAKVAAAVAFAIVRLASSEWFRSTSEDGPDIPELLQRHHRLMIETLYPTATSVAPSRVPVAPSRGER